MKIKDILISNLTWSPLHGDINKHQFSSFLPSSSSFLSRAIDNHRFVIFASRRVFVERHTAILTDVQLKARGWKKTNEQFLMYSMM